jgi:AcrR family transcriptional regulator
MTQSTEHTRTEASARGNRLGQQDYFDVALDILGKQGHEALTIAVLCEVLDVSKGSFYHHFGGWPGFMEALLTYWEQVSAVQVAEMASRVDDPHARSGLLRNMGLVVNHDAEAAIRVWARSEPVAEQVQERVDKSRIEVLTDLIALRLPRPDARRLAELAHVTIVGTQMTSRPFSHQVMLRQFKLLDSLIEARYKAHVFF